VSIRFLTGTQSYILHEVESVKQIHKIRSCKQFHKYPEKLTVSNWLRKEGAMRNITKWKHQTICVRSLTWVPIKKHFPNS